MTKNELNVKISRLYRVYSKSESLEDRESLKKEFVRLYRVDRSFEYINHKNLLRMLEMNSSLRAVTLHDFGMHINSMHINSKDL